VHSTINPSAAQSQKLFSLPKAARYYIIKLFGEEELSVTQIFHREQVSAKAKTTAKTTQASYLLSAKTTAAGESTLTLPPPAKKLPKPWVCDVCEA
jgi:hypothetical protein